MINLSKNRVLVTGGAGFLGHRIVIELYNQGVRDYHIVRSMDYDLRCWQDVQNLLCRIKPDIIIHAASHSGGIGLNQEKPGELFYNNAMMGIQLMELARQWEVEKFVQIGTICEYPKYTPVPFEESELWNGFPETTNSAYGLAKKALLVMGQAYRQQYGFNVIHLLPVNLYGPGDNFNPNSSHVIPALIQKIWKAKQEGQDEVVIWGDGTASREFLYVEDAAEAIVKATMLYDEGEPVNIGIGSEITINQLVTMIAYLLDYDGHIVYDTTKPNGQPRRCLNTIRAWEKFGFKAKTDLKTGLKRTIDWYLKENK